MKTPASLQSSMMARLKQSKDHAKNLVSIVEDMTYSGIVPGDIASLREQAESILQCVHEFSAYHNAYETN
jgi:hypothetical protein